MFCFSTRVENFNDTVTEVVSVCMTTEMSSVIVFIQGFPGPVGRMGPKGVRVSTRCSKVV